MEQDIEKIGITEIGSKSEASQIGRDMAKKVSKKLKLDLSLSDYIDRREAVAKEALKWLCDGQDQWEKIQKKKGGWFISQEELLDLADQILSLFPEPKVLSVDELIHLNEQWEEEYEDVEMTDAEWELKRWQLIAQAQLRAIVGE